MNRCDTQRYKIHIDSKETLERTALLLKDFNYNDLVSEHISDRKTTLMWLAILLGRPQILKETDL